MEEEVSRFRGKLNDNNDDVMMTTAMITEHYFRLS